ncbi:MAG TPA: hypothetical protein VER04_24340, partial [Polyangiaceae bacterium]|nr:hypothetical protein [Polyangiaceae bacterium]
WPVTGLRMRRVLWARLRGWALRVGLAMNRDMQPLPTDDYFIRCMKLQHAAKAFNKAQRELLEAYERRCKPQKLVDADREARALLDACIAAMGEPVLLGSADARVA